MKTFRQDFCRERRKEVEINIWDQDITFKILMLIILFGIIYVKLTFDEVFIKMGSQQKGNIDTWRCQVCQRGRRKQNPRWRRRTRSGRRGNSFCLIWKRVFLFFSQYDVGTFSRPQIHFLSFLDKKSKHLPSTIVSRFPLQGRSAVSKALSGISPSGLKNIGKLQPKKFAQGI